MCYSFAYAYVECLECGAQGPDVAADTASVDEYEAEAIAAWNRRSHLKSVPTPGSDPVEAPHRLVAHCAPPSPAVEPATKEEGDG